MALFKTITVIGSGLIGSSVLRAIKASGACEKLIAIDANMDVCARVRALGLADMITADLHKGIMDADCVVLATPLGSYQSIMEECGPLLKSGAIVTDVGSVKQHVLDTLSPLLPESVHLIPAHPIAGHHKSGPEAGFTELFQERWCIITPPENADIRALEKITALWEAFGAKIEIMDAKHHDMVLGITSHLPHLIAYTIVDTATQLEDELKSEVIQFSAGGFQDFTRIAASDPTMWRDVFLTNKDAVLDILQRFTEDLTSLQKSIRRGDGKHIFEVFSRTRDIRKAVADLGASAIPAPIDVMEEDMKEK